MEYYCAACGESLLNTPSNIYRHRESAGHKQKVFIASFIGNNQMNTQNTQTDTLSEVITNLPATENNNTTEESSNNNNQQPTEESSSFSSSSIENKLLRKWMIRNTGKMLSESVVQELLDILHDSVFNTSNVAKNIYQLKKVDNEILEHIPVQCSMLTSGQKIYYHNMLDVLRIILENKALTTDWEYCYNPSKKNHWCGFPAWQEYEEELINLTRTTNSFYHLLLPVLFIDDYLADKTKQVSNTGFYFSIANLSVEKQLSQISKYCLCTAASDSEVYQEIFHKVIIKPIRDLEEGRFEAFFYPFQKTVKFFGGVHAITHDHIGAVKTLQKLGPKAKFASRFFANEQSFANITHPSQKEWIDSGETQLKMERISSMLQTHGQKGIGKNLAMNHGLAVPIYSPNVFDLKVFGTNVYKRCPPCELHQDRLGILKKVLLFFGVKKGKAWCESVNSRVKLITITNKHERIDRINYIYKFNSMNSAYSNGLAAASLSGFALLSVAKILVALFYKIISKQEMEFIILLLKFLFIIREKEVTRSCQELSDLIFMFKTKFQEVFPADELAENETELYNYQFVNFDTIDAWPEILNYLGPSILYSGEHWEIMCQGLRRSKFGNNQNANKDALTKEAAKKQLQWYEAGMEEEKIQKPNFSPVISSKEDSVFSVSQLTDLKSCYQRCFGLTFTVPRNNTTYKQIIVNGKALTSNSNILVEFNNNNYYGDFKFIFSQTVAGKTYEWLCLNLYKKYKTKFQLIELNLQQASLDYIPISQITRIAHQYKICGLIPGKEIVNNWVELI